jgi:hypothetical protein
MSTLTLSSLQGPSHQSGNILMPNGCVVSPGQIIQTAYLRTDTKASYSASVNTNTSVDLLTKTFTPKYASSAILLQYNIFYEVHHDVIFRISRNDVVIGNNTTDSNRWSGTWAANYDTDVNSTPVTGHFMYWDTPNTTSTLTYKFLVSASGGTGYTFFLNRIVGSAGQDAWEVGISQLVIQEIAQ